MARRDDPNIETLNWICDFLNTDLCNLSNRELSSLKFRIEKYFINQWVDMPFLSHALDNQDHNMLRRDGLRYIEGSKVDWPKDYPWFDTIEKIQSILKNELKKPSSRAPMKTKDGDLYILKNTSSRLPLSIEWGPYGASVCGRVFKKDWQRKIGNPSFLVNHTRLVFHLCLLFSPDSRMKICKEEHCGKFFLGSSSREKNYCSPKCASKAGAREYRERDPKGYREKQRILMRNKIIEKKALELGIPKDQVKLRKRTPKQD